MIALRNIAYTVYLYSISGTGMRRHNLPDFGSPTTERLRELYRRSNDELVRRTVLEVIRLRDLVAEIDDYRETIHKCWAEETHSRLVALENLRVLMQRERSRMGLLSPSYQLSERNAQKKETS
jgi:hypothetical protein